MGGQGQSQTVHLGHIVIGQNQVKGLLSQFT